MKKLYEYGGILASVVLIAFGIGALVAGLVGRDHVRDELARLLTGVGFLVLTPRVLHRGRDAPAAAA